MKKVDKMKDYYINKMGRCSAISSTDKGHI